MKKKVNRQQATEEVNRFADRVSAEDVNSTIGNEGKFKLLFSCVENLARYWDEVALVFMMLKDYASGRYRQCPWRTIAVLVGALGYVLAPLDLIPDFVPLIGWTDDCMALGVALSLARKDLEAYRAWKSGRSRKAKDAPIDV